GGVLDLEMSDQPNDKAFTIVSPSSVFQDHPAVPVISGDRTFRDKTTVTLSTITPGAKIMYTIDGCSPSANAIDYSGPFTINRTTTINAIAIMPHGTTSFKADALLTKLPNDWTVKVTSGYSTQYTGGGDNAIVDGIRGTTNFASGEWQGIQGKPYEAVIDLQRATDIKEVGGSFLQVAGPWIWMPSN